MQFNLLLFPHKFYLQVQWSELNYKLEVSLIYNLIYSGDFWRKDLNPHACLQLSLQQDEATE